MSTTDTDSDGDSHSERSPYIEAYSRSGRQLRFDSGATPHYHPNDVFKKVIQQNAEICNNCFSRRFDYTTHEYECGELGWLNYSRRECIPGRNDPDPNRELRRGQPVFCARCGHRSGKDRPLAYRDATAHAGRLSAALTRRGIDHDRKTLLAVTVDKIGEPDTTGIEDAAVFPVACAEAIRAVN